MGVLCRKKLSWIFSVCACILILLVYLHDIPSPSKDVSLFKQTVKLKAVKQVKRTVKPINETIITLRTNPVFKTYSDPFLISLRHLLAVSVKAVQVGGLRLKEIRKEFDIQKFEGQSFKNQVSSASLLSYKAIHYILKNSFPKIQIVSKEGYNQGFGHEDKFGDVPWIDFDDATEDDVAVSARDILVWIDPLDGSKSFKDNHLEYVTTMACVAIKGKPVIGVIHQPFENVTMWGCYDGISAIDGATLSLRSETSFPRVAIERRLAADFQNHVRVTFGHDVNALHEGSEGYKLLQLVVGNVDAYVHAAPLKKWDLCAGNAIVRALNGNMTGFNGARIDYGDPSKVTHTKGVFGTISDHEQYFDLTNATNSTYGS